MSATRPTRGGLLDLLLLVVALAALGARSPVGGLAAYSWAYLSGTEATAPLTAWFMTGPGPVEHLAEILNGLDARPTSEAPADGFQEPYRTAARTTLVGLPEHVMARVHRHEAADAMAYLDGLEGRTADEALATLMVGEDAIARATHRAQLTGHRHPRRYSAFRPYLSARDRLRADAVVTRTLQLGTALDLRWPIEAPHRVSSPFGQRVHPVLGTKRFHNGVDLAVPTGTPVLAANGGTVAVASHDAVNGNYLVIDHGHGVRTSYCHLDELLLPAGSAVTRGRAIARSGSTGRSTGPHLHFTLRVGGDAVDPLPLRRLEVVEQPRFESSHGVGG